MINRYLLPFLLLMALLTACAPADHLPQAAQGAVLAAAESDRFPDSAVPYPEGYRAAFVHYLTVDRPDATVRDIYISPEAITALRLGQPLPENTVIVIEGYAAQVDAAGQPLAGPDGRYLRAEPLDMLHVAHRRSGWAEGDYPSVARAGRWNFGSFDTKTGAPFDEDLAACFNCHQTMSGTDFLYTTEHLLQYARTEEPQYLFCNLRRRVPC